MFNVLNLESGMVIKDVGVVSSDFFSGWLGQRFVPVIKPLLFKKNCDVSISVSSWFCCVGMDLVFLDYDFKVVDLVVGFMPFDGYVSRNKVRWLLELPVFSIYKCDLEVGDRLVFISS